MLRASGFLVGSDAEANLCIWGHLGRIIGDTVVHHSLTQEHNSGNKGLEIRRRI